MAGSTVSRNHTEACRDRMAQMMMAAGDERILRALDRTVANEDLRREVVEPPQIPVVEGDPNEEALDMDADDIDESDPMLSEGEVMRLSLGEEPNRR